VEYEKVINSQVAYWNQKQIHLDKAAQYVQSILPVGHPKGYSSNTFYDKFALKYNQELRAKHDKLCC
jgi:hypothetical protein